MKGRVLVANRGMKVPGGRTVGRGMAVPELEDHPRLPHLLKSKQLDWGDPKEAKKAAAQYKKNCKASDETAERLKRKGHASDHVVPNLADLMAEGMLAEEANANIAGHRVIAEGGTEKEAMLAYEEVRDAYLRDNSPDDPDPDPEGDPKGEVGDGDPAGTGDEGGDDTAETTKTDDTEDTAEGDTAED